VQFFTRWTVDALSVAKPTLLKNKRELKALTPTRELDIILS